MSSTQRKYAYLGIFLANAALVVCTRQGWVPANMTDGAHMLSIFLAMWMKEVGAGDAAEAKQLPPGSP